jgi:ribosomal protein L11 methyltransferase
MVRIELIVNVTPRDPWTDIAISQFSEIGFDSFLETENGVVAYINEEDFQEDALMQESFLGEKSNEYSVDFSINKIPHQNWNALWESDFHPVFVEDKLTILAPFHENIEAKGVQIIIQPQMSFGTGHHQTTWMMTKAMMELETMPKRVLDMGTGTGVLAILAEKLGATDILAIDIESWSVENTIENVERNGGKQVESLCGDVELIAGRQFDLILANINKNVLKAHISAYSKALVSNGKLLLSGFFDTDAEEMCQVAAKEGFVFEKKFTKETWAALQFIKS